MRFKHLLVAGMVLALPALFTAQLVASDGILSRLHHHKDCDAKQSVVRLPAQEIRIETTQPRVTVNQGMSHPRMRGFFPAGQQAFMPVAQGPFFATMMPMQGSSFGLTSSQPSAHSNAIRALQEMELQANEAALQMATHKIKMDQLTTMHKRAMANMSATLNASGGTSADPSLQDTLNRLEKRISDIERLLLIHDNILQKQTPKQP